MKRKSSRYRALPFPARFVRSSNDHQPDPARLASSSGQSGLGSRRIFVIKQVRRLESTTATHKKIRRILIFDNHPDSLDLVFGRQASPHLDLSRPPRVSPWELILLSILTVVALIGMFWPLF
jgi:hypothetical protein